MSNSNGQGITPPQLAPPEIAIDNDNEAEGHDEQQPISYLLFESRASLCAIAANAVSEVLLLPEIAPLDGAPHWVGVLDVRGRIVPIIEPGELAGAAPRRVQSSDSVIIIESERGPLGLIVEAVSDVRLLWPSEIEIAPERLTVGLARIDGELVRLFDSPFFARFAQRHNGPNEIVPARHFAPDASPFERALFAGRARALRADANITATDSYAPSLVAVRLGGEVFGFELKWVREFAALPTVTPVPGAPSDLLGLVNLRGEVVPLLDLRPALGLAMPDDYGSQITFVECSGVRLGIAVEAVLDVFAPAEGEMLPPPAASGLKGDAVTAAVFYGDATLGVLDLCNLLKRGGWTEREGARML
ncbi:hypothetical protein EON83_17405 [bacterium]|nr:MAG: hypothetical protein EON83_17405 [bacterium]